MPAFCQFQIVEIGAAGDTQGVEIGPQQYRALRVHAQRTARDLHDPGLARVLVLMRMEYLLQPLCCLAVQRRKKALGVGMRRAQSVIARTVEMNYCEVALEAFDGGPEALVNCGFGSRPSGA